MIITIYDNNKYEDEFFNWLITEIRIYVFSSIDDSKLLKIDNYINSNDFFKSVFKKSISSKEALYASMYNLQIKRYWNRVVIQIDPNKMLYGTTTKLITVAKLVNYGALSVIGYPVITKCFKFVEDHIEGFYEKYQWLRGF